MSVDLANELWDDQSRSSLFTGVKTTIYLFIAISGNLAHLSNAGNMTL